MPWTIYNKRQDKESKKQLFNNTPHDIS